MDHEACDSAQPDERGFLGSSDSHCLEGQVFAQWHLVTSQEIHDVTKIASNVRAQRATVDVDDHVFQTPGQDWRPISHEGPPDWIWEPRHVFDWLASRKLRIKGSANGSASNEFRRPAGWNSLGVENRLGDSLRVVRDPGELCTRVRYTTADLKGCQVEVFVDGPGSHVHSVEVFVPGEVIESLFIDDRVNEIQASTVHHQPDNT